MIIPPRIAYAWRHQLTCSRLLLFALQSRLRPSHTRRPIAPVRCLGLTFPNPVGLAAGFDRSGKWYKYLAPVGFGFIEIGTIHGGGRGGRLPRWRLVGEKLDQARHGSGSSEGNSEHALMAVSLGSKREIFDDRTAEDYCSGMEVLWDCADFLVINLSRPGGPAREARADPAALRAVLDRIKERHSGIAARRDRFVPIVVKTAVETADIPIPHCALLARELQYDGVIAAFEHWRSRAAVVHAVHELATALKPLALIVAGGIRSAGDACEILAAGAALVQIYSALLELGPRQTNHLIDAVQSGAAEASVARGSL